MDARLKVLLGIAAFAGLAIALGTAPPVSATGGLARATRSAALRLPPVHLKDVAVANLSGTTTLESGGTVTFDVTLDADPGGTVTVDLDSSDTTEGEVSPPQMTFDSTNWSTSQQATVTGQDDTVYDGDVAYTITLTPDSGAGAAVDLTNLDDDPKPTVSFTSGSQSQPEGAAAMTVTAQLSAAAGLDVTVPYTVGGTAVDPADYTIDPSPLVIPAGNTTGAITISVVEDALDEAYETVVVTMGAPVNADPGTTTEHTATIEDNDPQPSISINDLPEIAEGGSGTTIASFEVNLSSASGLTVTVQYATSEGTAIEPEDFTHTTGTLTFAPGDISETISVPIVGDMIDEGSSETFLVNLSNASNASIADAQGVGTIIDDDNPPSITINDVTVTEGNSGTNTAVFPVNLSAASGLTITVDYATAEGTATEPEDYTYTAGTLIFTPGDTTENISVPIVGDTIDEGASEAFTVVLTSPANATISKGTGTGTINDNDPAPTVDFDLASQGANEGSGSMSVLLELSNPSKFTVEVPFTESGTAQLSTDYTIDPSPVSFVPGSTQALITINLLNDFSAEPDETVVVTMGTPVNANPGTITEHTATILNDDFPGLTPLTSGGDPLASLLTSEGGLSPSFTVQLDTQPAGNVVIDVASSNDKEGVVSPGSLTFTASDWDIPQTVTVTGVDDFTADGDVNYSVTLAVDDAATADPNYDALADIVVPAVNSDNDIPGYTVLPTGDSTSEGETSVHIDILLKTRPQETVTLDFSIDKPAEATLSMTQLVVDPDDWFVDTPYRLTVTGKDDPDPQPDITYHITITPNSGDNDYNKMEPNKKSKVITLTNRDAPTITWELPVGDEGQYVIDNLVPIRLRVKSVGAEPIGVVTFYYWDPDGMVYVPIGEDSTPPYEAYLVNIDDLRLAEWTQVFARAYSPDPPGPELPTFSTQERILIFRRDEFYRNYMPLIN